MSYYDLFQGAIALKEDLTCKADNCIKEASKKISVGSRGIVSSDNFRFLVIAAMFLFLVISRLAVQSFGISLGYLYLVVISLAGIWFGICGGLLAAVAAAAIFIAEISYFGNWPFRDLVLHGAYFRLTVFLLSGLAVGYISETEKRLKDSLKDLAYHDELTGCVNYRWTMHILDHEIERSERYGKEMSIAIIDIDHFKDINDTYGHIAGNEILRGFVNVLKDNIRAIDTVGRYGGEEFIIVFPENDVAETVTAIERIRKKLSAFCIENSRFVHNLHIPIRFSAGVASFPSNGRNLEDMLDMADKALYRAKYKGRDQTAVENRRWKRIRTAEGLKVELAGAHLGRLPVPVKVKDISQRGMLLVMPEDIPAGELLLKLRFPEDKFTSEFKCKVVRKSKDGDIYYAGICFVDIAADAEKKILEYVKNPLEPVV